MKDFITEISSFTGSKNWLSISLIEAVLTGVYGLISVFGLLLAGSRDGVLNSIPGTPLSLLSAMLDHTPQNTKSACYMSQTLSKV